MGSKLIGALPGHSMLQPHFRGGWKQAGFVHRCGRHVDARLAARGFVEELAAANTAKLAHHTLRGFIGSRMARQNLELRAAESQPSDRRRGVRPAAGHAVANNRAFGFTGNAKPNRCTKAAAFTHLHGLPTQIVNHRLGLRSILATGAHAANRSSLIPAAYRQYVWLGSATAVDSSFPFTEGGEPE